MGDAVATWTPMDVNPFIIGGLAVDGVTGARVQHAAGSIAVAVCGTLGRAALNPVFACISKPAKEFLSSRLQAELGDPGEDGWHDGEEDDDAVELTGAENLCVLCVGLRPPQQHGLQRSAPLTDHNEECFMDLILEETGLAFGGDTAK